jgi:signal peptide peptidase SppA
VRLIEYIQDCVWAIHPAKLDEITAFVERRWSAGDGTAEDAWAATARNRGNRDGEGYEVREGGVAIISVSGSLTKRANMLSNWSGGTSYQILRRDVEAAGRDPAVKAIVLDIDSPGGTTDGIVETVDAIASVGRVKPVVAYGQGMMTSAAQWIASAAGKRVIGPTTQAGSIGVAMVHYDASKSDERAGVKRTEIFSGKYKRMGSDAGPLSDEARAYLQERCDYLYGLFVEGVARNMGLSVEETLEMADGRIYTGQQAVDAGLADRIGTLELALELARGERKNAGMGAKGMDIAELKEKHPALYAEAMAEGEKAAAGTWSAKVDAARLEGQEDGIGRERARVAAILDKGVDYPEAAKKAIEEGMAVEAAGWLFLEAERTARKKALDGGGGVESAGGSAQAKGDGSKPPAGDFMAEVDRYQLEHKGCKRVEAMKAVARKNPELHAAYTASLGK